ncbi:MAG: T9SS type A sorting domain-containing protein [Bacteroidia bacterium]|nr:T9SS type A sorting domain-containing protein [Bacteroidia bacterium]
MRIQTAFLPVVFLSLCGFAQPNAKSTNFSIKGGLSSTTAKITEPTKTQVIELPKQALPEAQATTKKTYFQIKKTATINLSDNTMDLAPGLSAQEMSRHTGKVPEKYNYPPSDINSSTQKRSSAAITVPALGQSFVGNSFDVATPNDNDMAISDSGMVVSVINSRIYIRDINNDSVYASKSLYSFKFAVNTRNSQYDPKVMYDPKSDRFVLVCLVGNEDSTSRVIVGFSKTNKPNGQWNLYVLPGNPLNNTLWTDYPMISMTEKELFLTVNLLTNNSPWQTGFVETIIWQMKKDSGYAGKTSIGSVLHSNIKYNGKAIRNLCPVKGGSKLYSPNMYFLSNRNMATQNDTVFLVNITDTIGAPSGTLTVKVLKTPKPYYFPPDGIQPNATNSLATNDARNLGAFIENNKIQYVHNTNNPANNHVTVYYGTIDNPQSANPVINGYYLPNDTFDIAYPNISYLGNSSTDNSSIITFDHSSATVFPGCSAIQADGSGNFSPRLKIKDGSVFINILSSGQERWGDYSGSQRRYNNPGEVWMSGYYSYNHSSGFPKAHAAWVAQIVERQKYNAIKETTSDKSNKASVFPNPALTIYFVKIELKKPEYLSFCLYDSQGKLVQELLRDWVKQQETEFSFNTHDLPKGIYILKITGNNNTNITKKVIVN